MLATKFRNAIAAGLLASTCGLAGCATAPASKPDVTALRQEVLAVERAFARSMAQRDHRAFTTYLADDAIFFGAGGILRGKAAVAAGWQRFFEKPDAPFSWEPAEPDVQVLDSGDLAISSGPVRNAKGELIATFTSIWRREAPGVWRIVLDKGNDVCVKCTP